MAYKLTPADRRARAALLQRQRTSNLSRKTTAVQPKKEEANGFTKTLHTVGDVGANVAIGLGKGVEGIIDLFAGIGGAVAGIFSDDAQDAVKEWIAKDHTGKLYGNAWQEGLDESLLNDSKVGQIIEGVAQGVGQMLPAVAVNLIPGAGQAASLAMIIGSAAGTGTEQAFGEGADYGEGMAYGAMTGAVEGVTEKLTGGAGKVIKNGILKNTAKEVADVGIKRIAKEAISEGAEEMISEVANPALKTIYKGKDALDEYGDAEFWAGVGEAGIIGAGTQLGYAGTVGKVTRSSGAYADTQSVLSDIDAKTERLQTLEEKGTWTPEQEVKITEAIKKDYEQLSKVLSKASDKTRANLMKNPQVALAFESDGALKADVTQNLDARITAAHNGGGSAFMSRSLYGKEAEVSEMLAQEGTKIYDGELTETESENLNRLRTTYNKLSRKGLVSPDFVISEQSPQFNAYLDGKTVVIGKDTLSNGTYIQKLVHEVEHFAEGTKEWAELASFVFDNSIETKSAIDTVMQSGYNVTRQDVDTLGENLKNGTLTKGQRTLISEVVALRSETLFGSEQIIQKLTRENRTLAKKILDRIKAFLDVFKAKTPEEREQVKRLQRAEQLFERALSRAGTKYAVNELTRVNEENVQVSEKNDGEGIDNEVAVQYAKRAKYISYDKLGISNVAAIKKQLYELYRGVGNSIANSVAIENGNVVYIVDSGKENGNISFGVRERRIVTDAQLRAEIIRRRNNESLSKGYISDGLSSKFGDRHDNNIDSGLRRESGAELSTDPRKPQHQQGGVPDGDGYRGVERKRIDFSDAIDQSAGAFDSWTQTLSDDPAGEGRNLSDVENGRGEMGVDDIYEGEQERNGAGDQERGKYDYQVDHAEVDRIIKGLREMLAQLDAEPSDRVQKSRKVQYSMAGPKAKTADYSALVNALGLSFSPENTPLDIKASTGWFLGLDDKWRFEIDDSKMGFHRNGIMRIVKELDEKRKNKTITKEENDHFEILYEQLENAKPHTLALYVEHDELFKAYPQLLDVKLGFAPNIDRNGYYSKAKDMIVLNLSRSPQQMKQTLIHEIQHAIQRIEGFTPGASRDLWVKKQKLDKDEKYLELSKKNDEANREMNERVSPAFRKKVGEFRRAYANNPSGENTLRLVRELYDGDGEDNALFRAWADASNALQGYLVSIGKRDPVNLYMRTAGEIEARDVADRLDLSAEERAEIFPNIEDVDPVYSDRDMDGDPLLPDGEQPGTDTKPAEPEGADTKTTEPEGKEQDPAKQEDFSYDDEAAASRNKKSPERGEGKYSYDLLVKKPDMVIKDVALASTQEAAQYRDDTVKFGADMRKNAAKKNNPKNTETETYLFCKDLKTDVLITKNSFKHGGARLDATYVTICKNVDVVLENSIVVNELSARDSTDGGYVLLGMVETPDNFVVVRSVVNKRSHRLIEFQQLDAIKKQEITKIEDVGLRPPDYPQKRGSATSSTISIAGLLDFVKNKNLANEVFSADVAQKLGVGRTKGSLSNDLRFSRKATTFTHNDVNEILSTVRNEALTFTLEDGTEIKGAIASKKGQELNTWLYDTLNTANLKDKRALARQIADRILDAAITESKQPLYEAIGEEASALVREDLALSVAAALGDKQAQIENKRKNAHFDTMRKIAADMRDVEKGRFYSATIYDGDTLRAIPNMLRAALKTSRAFTGSIRNTLVKVKDWYCAEDNAMMYKPSPGEHNEGMANGQVVFDKDIAAMLEQLTSGTGALSVQELEMVVDIAKHFQKLSERYQKVFINGKWVDAEEMAEEFVKVMQTAQKDQNWIVRGLLNKYMRQFGDPAALFRAMDAYNPKGFYTKMHEWMRNAAISMQSDELHALKEYYEWHEKHKKWAKHLENDLIEFRGEKMTVGQFMTLYCESKTEKSKQGLADNGFKFTDKDGVPHRIKGLLYEQVKGENASKKHDRADVQRACKQLENEIWSMLSEEQRAYIKLLENVLNTTCRKWKIDTDTLMKGFSRVHERGYYFPSAHNGIAKTVDTTFYEGDRVGHLSLNKEAVEGARGELVIDGIDNVVLRHVHNMALYKNYAIVAENRSMLQNIDVGRVDGKGERIKNVHQAVTIRTTSEEYGKYRGTDMMKLLDKMSSDLQGGRRAGQDEQKFLKDLVEKIRGNYARFQLGLNPKTLATQLSSLIAAGNILEYNCIVRGIKGFGSPKTAQLVDKYCPLAELRNFDNSAALAAGVLETTGKVGDVLMKGIGFVDRRVICSLFNACQLQVQKDSKLELGTEDNLKAAGELLTRVILETQQNSLVTEKSDAMRGGIFSRTFTMFTADGMKVIGRWFDAIGEWAVLHKRHKDAKTDTDKARLKKELKRVHGQFVRSTSALTAQAAYMAVIAYLFKLLYNKDEEEVGENLWQGMWDFFGGLIGGLPIARDIYSYFTEGYELDNFFLSTINDVLVACKNAFDVAADTIAGKDVSRQDVAGAVRKAVYAGGQVLGIPVRNAYNFVTGLTRRFVPEAGYVIDSTFSVKAYSSDLGKAIEAGDEHMVETIAGLMTDEKIGIEDGQTRAVLKELVGKGHSVLPRAVGDSVTLNGETVTLTGAQQKRLRTVYAIGEEAIGDMVRLKRFAEADDAVKAKAIQFIYDVYWDLALEDVLGEDFAEKNVLFAEAIDIEKLAIIIATARSIEADKDKDGRAIAGTKKRKVEQLVGSLRLTAAQKYMVMGYLGYTNTNGKGQVEGYIGTLKLSAAEKKALLKYSGYAA